jgi:site-specific DNA recombinase
MNAIGYVRVSTEEQAQEGVSLENQRERIRAYCEQRGLTLLDVIEDAGISGGTNKMRPGFNALLDRLENDSIDVLVLYSLERLSRDLLTLLTVKRMCDLLGVQIHTGDGEDGRMTFLIKGVFAEMEQWQIKERTRKAMA